MLMEYFREHGHDSDRLSLEFGETYDTILKETWHWVTATPKNVRAAPVRADVREVQIVLAIGANGCHFEWDAVNDVEAASVAERVKHVCSEVLAGRYVEVVWEAPFTPRRLEAVVGSGPEAMKFALGFPMARLWGRRKEIRFEAY